MLSGKSPSTFTAEKCLEISDPNKYLKIVKIMNRKPKGGGGGETPNKENLVEEGGIPHAHKCVVQGFPSQAITGD